MRINTKVLTVALTPLYGYLAVCIYVFIHSQFDLEMMEPKKMMLVIVLLLMAGLLAALKERRYHMISLLLYLIVGVMGIYSGLLVEPMNWIELIASAFVIAFAIAFYEMVENHREIWHEN